MGFFSFRLGAMRRAVYFFIISIFLFLGCSKFIHYHPEAPENMRATEEEKTALKELELKASNTVSPLHKDVVMTEYLKVSKRDGINPKEAVTLAQSEMFFHSLENKNHISQPTIVNETETQFTIEFPAINRRLTTEILPSLLVFVDRAKGVVAFSSN